MVEIQPMIERKSSGRTTAHNRAGPVVELQPMIERKSSGRASAHDRAEV